MKNFKRLFILILIPMLLISWFLFSRNYQTIPKQKPYIYKNILYLKLKEIPIKNIKKIEIIENPVLYVIIHYENGLYALSSADYLKVREYLWTFEK